MGSVIVPTLLGVLSRFIELMQVKHLAQGRPEGVRSIIIVISFYSFVSSPLKNGLEKFSSSSGKTLFFKEMKKKLRVRKAH